MKAEISSRLLQINHQFYQTFALQFSATRQRLQPGVRRVIENIPAPANILDLGCGNGELLRELGRQGFHGAYTGLDFSAGLLAEARQRAPAGLPAKFYQADLAAPGWDAFPPASFDFVLAFAVLHHLPGKELRLGVLRAIFRLLKPGGYLIRSEWQFLNSPRLRARILDWDRVDLSAGDVDPGDYLLDWKSGGYGIRYVHHFDAVELADLAQETGFDIQETFLSDGQGGQMSSYQFWQRPIQAK